MGKKFERKFMHRSRQKLADMVETGQYEKDTQIGWTKESEERKVGDTWEDEFHKYEQKEGFIKKTSKNSGAFEEVRKYVQKQLECKNPDCKTIKLTDVDKKLIKRANFCTNCLVEQEHKIRTSGLWSEYQNYKIWTRMVVDGRLRLEQIKQAKDDLKQHHDYVLEDGSSERWTLPQPVEEIREEMETMISNGTKEIEELDAKRMDAFNKLKEKGYESYL